MKKLLPIFFTLLLFYSFTPSPSFAQSCGPSATDRNSWPDDCHDYIYQGRFCPLCANNQESCNKTQYMIPYCAQSFEAHQTIEVSKQDCEYECDGKWWAQQNWKGTVTIDPTETKVPFAGKKKEAVDSDIHEDEIKYLADYFEGTHEYYRDYPLRITIGPFALTVAHGVSPINMTNFQGVLRKLAPYEYQNDLKKQMVERAIASNNGQLQYGAIHDYQANYLGRLCWNAPFWMYILNALKDHFGLLKPLEAWRFLNYCLYYVTPGDKVFMDATHALLHTLKIPHWGWPEEKGVKDYLSSLDGHFPPEPDEEDYVEKWNAWKESDGGKWFKLWLVTPMVTREDTLALIKPDPQLRDYPGEYWAGPTEVGIRVPHLARLFETSRWIQQILLPKDPELERTSDQKLLAKANSPNNPVVLGSSNEGSCGSNNQVLGEKTYLAQAASCSRVCPPDIQFWGLPQAAPGEYSFNSQFCVPCDNCNGVSHLKNLRISDSGGNGGWAADSGGLETQCPRYRDTIWGTGYSPSRVRMDVGSTFTVSVSWEKATTRSPTGCCVDGGSGSCTIKLIQDAQGNYHWETTCGVPPPAPIPSCHKPPVPQSPECVEPAITDTNPNDEICSPKITGELSAMEEIENPYCEECMNVDCLTNPTDPCCGTFTVDVYRQMEVKTELPYLSQSWDHATDVYQGFFNFFRPYEKDEFEDIPAKSEIKYDFEPDYAVPEIGDFYYPLLGGVQLSKEWLINTLMPYVE